MRRHVERPEPIDRARGDRGDRQLVVRLAASEHGWRRSVARRGRAFLHHLESAHVRADRRHCRGADDVAAGRDRQRAQLGLSLLLAARFHVRAVRADERRLQGGSARVARLAAARGGGRSVEAADHVRPGGRAAPARIRSAVAARLRRLASRPRRQRRGLAAAARCLWRGDGHAVSRAPRRHSAGARFVDAAARAAEISRGQLGSAGRRHLGSARAAASFHAFESGGVAGVRSRDQDGGEVRRGRAGRSLAGDRAIGFTPRSARKATMRHAGRSRSTTARKNSTRRCC